MTCPICNERPQPEGRLLCEVCSLERMNAAARIFCDRCLSNHSIEALRIRDSRKPVPGGDIGKRENCRVCCILGHACEEHKKPTAEPFATIETDKGGLRFDLKGRIEKLEHKNKTRERYLEHYAIGFLLALDMTIWYYVAQIFGLWESIG